MRRVPLCPVSRDPPTPGPAVGQGRGPGPVLQPAPVCPKPRPHGEDGDVGEPPARGPAVGPAQRDRGGSPGSGVGTRARGWGRAWAYWGRHGEEASRGRFGVCLCVTGLLFMGPKFIRWNLTCLCWREEGPSGRCPRDGLEPVTGDVTACFPAAPCPAGAQRGQPGTRRGPRRRPACSAAGRSLSSLALVALCSSGLSPLRHSSDTVSPPAPAPPVGCPPTWSPPTQCPPTGSPPSFRSHLHRELGAQSPCFSPGSSLQTEPVAGFEGLR